MFYLGEKECTLYHWSEEQNSEAWERIKARTESEIGMAAGKLYIPINIILEELPDSHPFALTIREQLEIENGDENINA